MKIKSILIATYIIMIPISYKITSNWVREYVNSRGMEYDWMCVAVNATFSIVWPVDIPITFVMFKIPLINQPVPSWL